MDRVISRVLFDHCVEVHGALVGRAVSEESTALWGNLPVSLGAIRLQGRKLGPNDDWLREQISHLPAIAAAIQAGQVDRYTSSELLAERMMGRDGWSGLRGDVWKDVSFKHVDPPLERSTWTGGLSLDQYSSREHQMRFYEMLLHFEQHGVPKKLLDVLELDDFQKENIKRLGEFRSLCTAVGQPRWYDAFHLWTAICNGLEFFLTMDEKFLRVLRENCADLDLHSPAVCPSELADVLDLPAVPLPIQEGEFIPFPMD